jgi:NADPH:quinone reductase-like Zn-dependent oxidoreductase
MLLGTMSVLAYNGACAPPPSVADAPFIRAMVYRCYGSPKVVQLENIKKPEPARDRVLVKVMAASVNPLDWHYLRGEPYFMRAATGIGRPSDMRMGVDFAGIVEAVGSNVTRFKPGDRVFGGADGSFAEYVTPRERGSIALLPPEVSFEQGAALPIAGITALQALRDKGQVKPGQRVLINGASGGVGTFAVQIAKILGAHVTGVCSTHNIAMMSAIGADEVIDYTHQDFTHLDTRYDLIIDNVGNHSYSEYRNVLTANGAVVAVGGMNCGICFGPLLAWMRDSAASAFTSQKRLSLLADLDAQDLVLMSEWMAQGKLKSIIDRHYPLDGVPIALAYLEQGHARGKVIIDIAESAIDQTKRALASSERSLP